MTQPESRRWTEANFLRGGRGGQKLLTGKQASDANHATRKYCISIQQYTISKLKELPGYTDVYTQLMEHIGQTPGGTPDWVTPVEVHKGDVPLILLMNDPAPGADIHSAMEVCATPRLSTHRNTLPYPPI